MHRNLKHTSGLSNLLYDHSSYCLTAVLDFDFAHIGGPISEYLFSFQELNGILTGSIEPQGSLRDWLLEGFPEHIDVEFSLARTWDNALAEAGAEKPSTIGRASHIANIWLFSQELCQPHCLMDSFIVNAPAEAKEDIKAEGAQSLQKYLTLWGF
jgi:hypothetical protein